MTKLAAKAGCAWCGGPKLKEKYKFCSKSCTASHTHSHRPNPFSLMTPEKRAELYANRSKSKTYIDSRGKSFELINGRMKADPKFRAKVIKANTAGKLASEKHKEAAARNLDKLRNNPDVEGLRRFKVADSCRQRNFGHAKKSIRTEGFGYTFRSYHEYLFACCLNEMNWEWEYEPHTIPYTDENGKDRHYVPDFFVKAEGLYFEIKGFNCEAALRNLNLIVKQTGIAVQMLRCDEVRSLTQLLSSPRQGETLTGP